MKMFHWNENVWKYIRNMPFGIFDIEDIKAL